MLNIFIIYFDQFCSFLINNFKFQNLGPRLLHACSTRFLADFEGIWNFSNDSRFIPMLLQLSNVVKLSNFVLRVVIIKKLTNKRQVMLQIQSPQFSNSSKINVSNFISPTRNKRIVSVEPCCSSLQSNRNNSYKKLDSPSKIQEHKRKKSQIGGGHTKTKSKDLVVEVNTLKEQYMALKIAYKELAAERLKQSEKQNFIQNSNQKITAENQRLVRDNENLKGKVGFLEGEIQRIKRESIKLVETWQFKMNAVQQKLSQKQKSLSQLREYLQQNSIPEPRSSKQRESEKNDKKFTSSLAILSDSLSMTYHNIDPLSNTSQYLSVSLNDCHERDLERKDHREAMVETVCNKVLQVSADVGSGLKEFDQNRKIEHNFKKIRKQLSKKIEVNIDDKHKDFINQIQPKTPMDRKTQNKTSKVPKIKLKKEDEYIESKSSKKKMSAR